MIAEVLPESYISDSEFGELLDQQFPDKAAPYAVLTAYVDESEMPREAVPVVAVGGGVGTGLQWSRLLKAWRKALDTEGIEVFHTVDFETPEGRIGTIYEGWDQPRRNAFHAQLIDAIKNNHIESSMAAVVIVDDFNRIATPERLQRHKGVNAHFFCAFMLVYQIAVWAQKMYPEQSITYYFEEGGPHESRFKKAYAAIAHEDVKRFYKLWLTPTFAPKDSQPGLQIADKMVYEAAKMVSHYFDLNPPAKHSAFSEQENRTMWKLRYPTEQMVTSGLDVHYRIYEPKDIEEFFQRLETPINLPTEE